MSDHELPGMWESADFSGGEADTENERKQEADARRERYAAAFYEQSNPGFLWADAVRVDLPDCAHWREQADAAMAVADYEHELIREAAEFHQKRFMAADAENERLRAELQDYRNRISWETNCGEHARLLDNLRIAEETISRVRALCDEYAESEREGLMPAGWAFVQWVRQALNGAPDASS